MSVMVRAFDATKVELRALNIALAHHCECTDQPGNCCSAHSLLKDERILKHMVFVRRDAKVYLMAEWLITDGP